MGAKNSKVKKGEKKGAAAGDESSDQVDKTATLPASFKKGSGDRRKDRDASTKPQSQHQLHQLLQELGEEERIGEGQEPKRKR